MVSQINMRANSKWKAVFVCIFGRWKLLNKLQRYMFFHFQTSMKRSRTWVRIQADKLIKNKSSFVFKAVHMSRPENIQKCIWRNIRRGKKNMSASVWITLQTYDAKNIYETSYNKELMWMWTVTRGEFRAKL